MYRKYFLIWLTAACLANSTLAGILPKDSVEQFELTFWESIKGSRHPTDYEAYLQSYPKGRFVSLARTRIARLRDNGAGTGSGPAASDTPSTSGATGSTATAASPARKYPADAARAVSVTPTAPVQRAPSRRAHAAGRAAETANAQTSVAGAEPHTQVLLLPAAPIAEVRDCDICPALAALPRGGFTMGSNIDDPSERPAFHVSINSAFAIGKYEVTVEQWNACVANGGCPQTSSDTSRASNTPARDISWDDARQYAVQKFATDVVEAAENLQRGIAALPQAAEGQPAILTKVRDGLEGVERSFVGLLERNGIKKADPVGQPFDPNLHQAMSEQDSDAHAPGTVIQAWTPSWTLHGRLLRPAMVVVAKAPAAQLAGEPSGAAMDTTA